MLAAEMSTVMFAMAIVTLLFTASYLLGFDEIEEYVEDEDFRKRR